MKIEQIKVRIWGTGKYALSLVNRIKEINTIFHEKVGGDVYKIADFIDSNPTKDTFYDQKVIRPEQLWELYKIPVIIAMKDYLEVYNELLNHGYKNYIWMYDYVFYGDKPLANLVKNINLMPIDSILQEYIKNIESTAKYSECYLNTCENPNNAIDICCGMIGNYGQDIKSAHLHCLRVKKVTEHIDVKTIAIYYNRYYNGGVEKVISLLLPVYLRLGLNVVFITDEKNDDEYGIPSGVKRIVIGRSIHDTLWLRKILNIINDNCVDYFISHQYEDFINYYLGLYMHLIGKKICIELHNTYRYIAQSNYENKCIVYNNADTVVTLSTEDRNFWSKKGINAVYIPNPIQEVDVKNNIKKIPESILWVGRVETQQKHVLMTVDVMRQVVKSLPSATLRIVGKGDNLEVMKLLKRKIKDSHLEKNILICGYHTDVSEYYQTSQIFMCTSEFEGFPMAMMDSKLYALPLVLFDLPYLEILKDKKGYIAVPYGDTAGMAKAIVKILSDNKLRDKMSADARNSIEPFLTYNLSDAWKSVIQG